MTPADSAEALKGQLDDTLSHVRGALLSAARVAYLARIGFLVERGLDSDGELCIKRVYEESDSFFEIALRTTTRRGSAKGPDDDLIAALESLTTELAARKCLSCGHSKPTGEFSRLKSGVNGRNRYCKVCERKRVAEYKVRKQAGS